MLYKKLYATLVGRVDNTLQYMAEMLLREDCGRAELEQSATMLKAALLELEEQYAEQA